MEVEIIGFMCYKKAKFSFPSSGITLLKGASGKGKTTILRAIKWCLFGNMRNVDQKTNKSGKLSVTIRTFVKGGKECVIYRQKRPNLLKFRIGRFEQIDAVAQSKINEIYGSENIWLLCSYLKQKKPNRLFEVSGTEKLNLLNKIAFHESNPTPYISKIEELLKKEKLRFEILQENFIKECASFTEYLKTHSIQLDDAIPEEKIKQLKGEITILDNEIADLRQRHIRHRKAFSALQLLDDRISDLQRKSKEIEINKETQIKEEDICRIEKQIEDVERKIEFFQHFEQQTRSLRRVRERFKSLEEKYKEYDKVKLCTEKDLYEIQDQHTKFKQNEDKANKCGLPYDIQQIEKEILSIKALLKMQPALKIHKNIMQLHQKILSFANTETPENIETNIQKQQEKIYELKQGKNVLSCPQCGHHVRYIKEV